MGIELLFSLDEYSNPGRCAEMSSIHTSFEDLLHNSNNYYYVDIVVTHIILVRRITYMTFLLIYFVSQFIYFFVCFKSISLYQTIIKEYWEYRIILSTIEIYFMC